MAGCDVDLACDAVLQTAAIMQGCSADAACGSQKTGAVPCSALHQCACWRHLASTPCFNHLVRTVYRRAWAIVRRGRPGALGGRGGGFPGVPVGLGGLRPQMGMGYRRGPQRGGFGSPGLLNPQVVSIFTNLFLQVQADDHVHVMCSRASVSGSWCCYGRGNQVA